MEIIRGTMSCQNTREYYVEIDREDMHPHKHDKLTRVICVFFPC